MLNFLDDYSEGAHPVVMAALNRVSAQSLQANAKDDFTNTVKRQIAANVGGECQIFFVPCGTSANLVMIAGAIGRHESVIAADTGHINLYEAGAVEATGRKILVAQSTDGKLRTNDIRKILDIYRNERGPVKPRLVYISNSTETGLVYRRKELIELSRFCKNNNLFLMIDGARLGIALSSRFSDVTLEDMYNYSDLFWIGGTKLGGLFGEAVILNHPEISTDFEFHIKQHGALISKNWSMSAQFEALFENELLLRNGRIANEMATKLANGFTDAGYQFRYPVESNQIFAIIPNSKIAEITSKVSFFTTESFDETSSVVRFVTSWATQEDQVEALLKLI